MASLLLRKVRPLGGNTVDVLVSDGVIARLEPDIASYPADTTVVEGEDQLLLAGFVDGHIHLDKTLWGLPWRPNQAGPRLIDKIENERRLRKALRLSPAEQSERLVREAIGRGSSWLRSHVDIDTENGLANLEGVMATREKLAGAIDIQLVAFPQSGLLTRPGTLELIEEAVAAGAEVVGGLDPAGIDRDPVRQLDAIFRVAERHGAMIDIHLHDGGTLGAFQIELIAERTRALGLQGRVAVSHAFCLGMIDDGYLTQLTETLLDSGVAIMTHGPGGSPFPPILRLMDAGVRLFSGSDGVRDAWVPFGNADMLERAWILSYRSNFRQDHDIERALQLATFGGAAALGVADYGLEVGCRADMVVVPGGTPAEAVVNRSRRGLVIKGGEVVAREGRCLV